jgi:hypothetical protein
MGDPVSRPQMGGSVLEGAAEHQRAFEAFVMMDGRAVASRQAGQVEGGATRGILLDHRRAPAAKASADPAPLGFGRQMGAESLKRIRSRWDGQIRALGLAAGFTLAEVDAQEDRKKRIAAGA